MKKQFLTEVARMQKLAGIIKENKSDNNDTMNITEYGPSSVRDLGSAIDVVASALDYVERFADTDDEADEEGFYGMNEAGRLAQSLEDLYDFLQSMNKKG